MNVSVVQVRRGVGTQNLYLGQQFDERIKVSAPVNMISATMQGGCLCENAPNLRLDVSNIEIGALMAPRPLLLVSANRWTGTVKTPTVEYPAIRKYLRTLQTQKIRCIRFQVDAEHNYNQESREAVYAWFCKNGFLGSEDASAFKEVTFEVEPDDDLLAFSEREMPAHALKQEGVFYRRGMTPFLSKHLKKRKPTNAAEFQMFREELGSGLQHALGLQIPKITDVTLVEPEGAFPTTYQPNLSAKHLVIGRKGIGDAIPAILFSPEPQVGHDPIVLIVHPKGKEQLIDSETGEPLPLIMDLLGADRKVLLIDVFGTGEHQDYERPEDAGFFTTYNRTAAALRVQDIVTTLRCFTDRGDVSEVNLIGIGEAGLWSLLAAGFTDVKNVVIDAAAFDNNSDDAFLETLPIPNIRQVGDFRTASTLVAPRSLTIHNTGSAFDTTWITEVYDKIVASELLHIEKDRMPDEEIAARVTSA